MNSCGKPHNDKHKPVDVAQQSAYMISYYEALPEHLLEFYQYLLSYPNVRPANVEDTFYWAREIRVKANAADRARGNPAGET